MTHCVQRNHSIIMTNIIRNKAKGGEVAYLKYQKKKFNKL